MSLGNLWPSPLQEQLLRAALCDGDEALAAFHCWRQAVDLDAELDHGSFRLLPLLYLNMQRLRLDDALMNRLKGTYRMAWCDNQQRLQHARTLLELLQREGIDTLVIKGVALAAAVYPNVGARPMADLDIVVPPEQARAAIRLVEQHGWRRAAGAVDDYVNWRHAMQFHHPKGGELDLHWHVLFDCCNDEADRFFWSSTQPVDVLGAPTRRLDATAALLHTVIHGVRWNVEPPLRWIADATMLLRRSAADIEWDRVVEFARSQKLGHRVRLGLDYLAERYQLPVPEAARERLRRMPRTLIERIEDRTALQDATPLMRSPLGAHWYLFTRYCRSQWSRPPLDFVAGFAHYLRISWQARGRVDLVAMMLRALLRRARPWQRGNA